MKISSKIKTCLQILFMLLAAILLNGASCKVSDMSNGGDPAPDANHPVRIIKPTGSDWPSSENDFVFSDSSLYSSTIVCDGDTFPSDKANDIKWSISGLEYSASANFHFSPDTGASTTLRLSGLPTNESGLGSKIITATVGANVDTSKIWM